MAGHQEILGGGETMNINRDISTHRASRTGGGFMSAGNLGVVSPTSGTVDF